jgi:hypothetical protein
LLDLKSFRIRSSTEEWGGVGVLSSYSPRIGGRGAHAPADWLALSDIEGLEEDLAEVAELASGAGSDLVLRCGVEDFAEDVVDVGGSGDLVLQRENLVLQLFGLAALFSLTRVKGAEVRMRFAAEHAAAAVVGESVLTETGIVGLGTFCSHGNLVRRIAPTESGRHGDTESTEKVR